MQLTTIILLVLAAVAVIFVLAALKPAAFRVERRARIRASSAVLYPMVADFHRWGEWSPWEKLDPAMTRTFAGPASGQGAVYGWTGNGKAGAGRMEITAAAPPTDLTIQLDFIRPFAARNTTRFAFATVDDGTDVTWTMEGPNLFIGKLMQVFMSFDAMIGKDFEAGLANMKAAAER